ncbi:MAG: hypothetical protein MI861_05695 [Pirellulales bacterium]|nr:hypothetical protein [Pirellulales bacterium]
MPSNLVSGQTTPTGRVHDRSPADLPSPPEATDRTQATTFEIVSGKEAGIVLQW